MDEILILEAKLAHVSAIAAMAIGQPDRAERVADRERVRQQLEAARAADDSDRCGDCGGRFIQDSHYCFGSKS